MRTRPFQAYQTAHFWRLASERYKVEPPQNALEEVAALETDSVDLQKRERGSAGVQKKSGSARPLDSNRITDPEAEK